MKDELLLRAYDVGFGDCIHVQIPDGDGCFHMLIDCGTSRGSGWLKAVVEDVRANLPREGQQRRLDLLVATHPHSDHINGFKPAWFKDVRIGRLWLTVTMNPEHAGARTALARQPVANKGPLKALREDLAVSSGIAPDYPLYVARDLAQRLDVQERGRYRLAMEQGTTCFRGFQEQDTCLRVLAPEWDIDKYYLGVSTRAGQSKSIDRRQLGRRLKNNASVVLLLEWRGRRLLFAGDAEWQGTGVEEGRASSSWDVMLGRPEVAEILLQPLDLFKVAHHGSHNGTPFYDGGKEYLPRMIAPDRTQVLVSTIAGEHGAKNPVPFPAVMAELGRLAANKRVYPNEYEKWLRALDQPQRTDLEPPAPGKNVPYVEAALGPVGD